MRGDLWLGLVRQYALAGQAAVRQQSVTLRMNHCFDCYRARLAAVELEGSQEVYVTDGFNMPAGNKALSSLCESLNAHHAGQHRGAIDLMVVQERLDGWIERSLDGEATINTHAC